MIRTLAAPLLSLALLALPSVASAEHCSNYQEVAAYAHDLDTSSQNFHEAVHDVTGYSHLADDAHELAYASADFHDSVEFGADCFQIQSLFHELSHTYQHMARRWDVAHRAHHHPYLEHDWQHVEDAFWNLQWAVRSGR